MEIKTTRLMPVESRLETIHRPKAVLDLRGLIMHAYHGSRDPDAILAAEADRFKINQLLTEEITRVLEEFSKSDPEKL